MSEVKTLLTVIAICIFSLFGFSVILYSSTLMATLLSVLIAIIVINLSRNKQNSYLPHYICNILTSRILSAALCLPKMDISDEYGKLNETYRKIPGKQQMMWILLGVAIDRISFLIYLPLVIYAIYLNY